MTFRRKATAIFALALFAAGCEQVQKIDKITGPAYNTFAQAHLLQGIEQPGSGQACTQQISPGQDATLSIPGYGHSLYIPKHASGSPAYYCMRVAAGSAIKVELFAFRNSLLSSEFHTFETPLRLTLSYQGAVIPEGSRLRIVNVVGDLVLVPVQSYRDSENSTLSAYLSHFSDYAVGVIEE